MLRRHTLALTLMTMAAGCASSSGDPNKPLPRVPAGGVIRVDGQPLAGAVVVFNPLDERGTLTQGETDEDGRYELMYASMPGGTSPGRYQVSVSYLVAPDGTPQGLGSRSALIPPPGFAKAVERLPEKYSNLMGSALEVTVPPEGGTFDFDLKGPLLDPPPASEEEPSEEEPSKEEPQPEGEAAENS